MKILKLLNRKNLSIFIFFFSLLLNNLKAEEEPVDIWDLEKKSNEGNTNTYQKVKILKKLILILKLIVQ